jgi:hypothetical protein
MAGKMTSQHQSKDHSPEEVGLAVTYTKYSCAGMALPTLEPQAVTWLQQVLTAVVSTPPTQAVQPVSDAGDDS